MSHEHLGSRWYKFDFHTHTPASSDYKKPTENETDWLKALMAGKIDCVAITDHVSGEWVDRLKATYAEFDQTAEWYRPICLFPGCEITVSTGQSRVHILAVFDPSCNSAKISAVLGQCGITEGHGDAEQTCATESVDNVIDIVKSAGGVAIPAHIDGPKGLLNGITNTNQEIESWLGKIEAAEFVNLAFLDGVNTELAKACEHLAKLQCSDAHECSRLGKKFSWIKMSKPSIAGLKLALHDHSFCLDNSEEDPNTVPNLFLSQLSISQMNHCGRIPGQPAEFKLHPLFNAIIGGRGSGKSTFIESVRLALGRENEASDLKQIQAEITSFKIGVTKQDTHICVDLTRRNERYKSVWEYGTLPYIQKYQENNWVLDNGNPEERFHVSLYSQKQINALASNANSLLEIIDRSIEVNFASWKHDYDTELDNFLALSRDVRQINLRLNSKGTLQGQLDDLNSDIDSFEQGGHKDVFNAYQKLVTERQVINKAAELNDLSDAIYKAINTDFSEMKLVEEGGDKPAYIVELEAIQQTFTSKLVQVQADLTTLMQTVKDAEESRNQEIEASTWFIQGSSTEENYNQVVTEYESRGEELNPEQYEAWLSSRNDLNEKIAALNDVESQLVVKKQLRSSSLRKLYLYRRTLQKNRQKFIRNVIGNNKYVRMSLIPFSNKVGVEQQFRNNIGVEASFSTSIYQDDQTESLLYPLISNDDNFENDNFKAKVRYAEKAKEAVVNLALGNAVEDYRIDTRLNTALAQKFERQPETTDRLMAWWPDDHLVVEYAKDIERGKFENIEKGSAGQKAAAILAFLLSHGNNPIIVDQPEDDLDNALIYQLIVSQIHENKKRRQIIMVTHNPNIVVNGDAEYVNVLEFRGGQVQVLDAGGLCEQSVRDHVCDILEGGAIAFDKRYKRLRDI
ncbi:histidinol phosphatase [Thalassotalea sp. 42_200_T64]|nr:histidinol phosphatase [Thalassotalea sp. 42_200_T64]